jgi:hypothetical protein
MKSIVKLFGIIAFAAVIGFSMASCGGDDDKGNDGKGDGNKGGNTVQETSGRLTITGLASYNGKFVVAMQDGIGGLIAAADMNAGSLMKGGKVANGSVTLKVWKTAETTTGTATASNYAGSDANVSFSVLIINNETIDQSSASSPAGVGTVKVSFTNGVGSGSYTSMF